MTHEMWRVILGTPCLVKKFDVVESNDYCVWTANGCWPRVKNGQYSWHWYERHARAAVLDYERRRRKAQALKNAESRWDLIVSRLGQ